MSDWLQTPLGWLFARRPQWRDAAGRWLLRIGYRYYWLLALVFAVAGAWDQPGVLHKVAASRGPAGVSSRC